MIYFQHISPMIFSNHHIYKVLISHNYQNLMKTQQLNLDFLKFLKLIVKHNKEILIDYILLFVHCLYLYIYIVI
jgi:hypothetical protein